MRLYRASRTANGQTTTFLHDGANVIADLVGGTPVRTYVTPGLDAYVSMTDHTGTTPATWYYNQDERSSVRNLTSATGAVAATYDYTAFGETVTPIAQPAAPEATLTQRYQYTGRELNAVSGTHHFRHRTYTSGLGAFTTRDPLGYVDGTSLYAGYFGMSMGVDPSGLESPLNDQQCAELRRRAAGLEGVIRSLQREWDTLNSGNHEAIVLEATATTLRYSGTALLGIAGTLAIGSQVTIQSLQASARVLAARAGAASARAAAWGGGMMAIMSNRGCRCLTNPHAIEAQRLAAERAAILARIDVLQRAQRIAALGAIVGTQLSGIDLSGPEEGQSQALMTTIARAQWRVGQMRRRYNDLIDDYCTDENGDADEAANCRALLNRPVEEASVEGGE